MLFGLVGFALTYGALCLFLDAALKLALPAATVFITIVVLRTVAGAFYAAVPPTSAAFIADNIPPERRAGALAALGASNGAGMVVGPGLAGLLAPYDLSAPLYIMTAFPAVSLVVLWFALPRARARSQGRAAPMPLFDRRLRRPLTIAFIAMFSVAVAQITVGFYALDRLGLNPTHAASAAGIALTLVGVALILSQTLDRKLNWPPHRLVRIGGLTAAIGFSSAFFAFTPQLLCAAYFVAAAGMGWVFPAFGAMAANAVKNNEQGAAAGAVSSAQGLGVILGPMIATLIYGFDESAPYLMIGAMMALLGLWGGRKS